MSELYFYLFISGMLVLSFLLFVALSVLYVLSGSKYSCKVKNNEDT